MSTTWVFLGVLAGREFAISHQLHLQSIKDTFHLAGKDLGKAGLGLAVSLVIVFGIKMSFPAPSSPGKKASVTPTTQVAQILTPKAQ